MTAIRILRPNVTREEALRHFTTGTYKLLSLFHGPARSIAELYIPFRLFEVKVVNGTKAETSIFGIETAQGVMDLYQFSVPPLPDQLTFLATRNMLSANLDAEEAKERLLTKVRRLVFARGFFRLRDVRFEASEIPGEIHVPYWTCFRGSDGQLRISVLDAVRRRPEGARARRVIEDWLRSREPLTPSGSMKTRVLS